MIKFVKTVFRILCLISLTICFGLGVILFTPLTEYLHRVLTTVDQPVKAEAVVILSSAFPLDTPKGTPGFSTLIRLEKGVELYRKGLAPKIIVLGGIEIPTSGKTTAGVMAERLELYGIPGKDVIVQDDIRGNWQYYDNLLSLIKKYENQFNFNNVMFVTSSEQTFRIRKVLENHLTRVLIIASEPYEQHPDWGRRFHLFRRVANEMFVAIPLFYLNGRF